MNGAPGPGGPGGVNGAAGAPFAWAGGASPGIEPSPGKLLLGAPGAPVAPEERGSSPEAACEPESAPDPEPDSEPDPPAAFCVYHAGGA